MAAAGGEQGGYVLELRAVDGWAHNGVCTCSAVMHTHECVCVYEVCMKFGVY